MELRHLRYFVALAEELHFGKAAIRLGISQPPLSQQIQTLEQETGARLFDRTNRRVLLTDAGRLFLTEARATLAQAERAVQVAGRAQRGEIGELAVGFFASAPLTAIVTSAIRAFRQAFPAVHLTLQEMPTMQQLAALEEHRLQVGFVRSPVAPELPAILSAVELFREPLVVAIRADHPLADADPLRLSALADEPFVFFPRESGTTLFDQVFSLCRRAGFTPRIGQEARDNTIIIGLVAAGLGISIVPASFRGIQVPPVVYRPLAETGATTRVWLASHRAERSPIAQAFTAFALDQRER